MSAGALRAGSRVLVRAPNWLGDVVMAEPAIRALLAHNGELSVAGPDRFVRLLAETHPGIRPVAADEARAWRGHEACVLLTNSFRSAWSAWRAGIPTRVGWNRDGRGLLLTHSARPAREAGRTPLGIGRAGSRPRWLPRPFGATCAELVGLLGVAVRDVRPRLEPTAAGHAAADRRLAGFGLARDAEFALVNAGGRLGSAKAFPAESWSRTVERLSSASDLPVLVVCGPGEEARAGQVGADAAAWVHVCTPAADLAELLALCARARVVVTADSGPRHLAVAVGTPVAVVCGPTDPRHTADHLAATRVVRVPVECGPCHLEACPLDGAERDACMRQVDPDALATAALGLAGRA